MSSPVGNIDRERLDHTGVHLGRQVHLDGSLLPQPTPHNCPASSIWQDFFGFKGRPGGVGQAKVDVEGSVPGDGLAGTRLVALDPVGLCSPDEGERIRDLVQEEPFVFQGPETRSRDPFCPRLFTLIRTFRSSGRAVTNSLKFNNRNGPKSTGVGSISQASLSGSQQGSRSRHARLQPDHSTWHPSPRKHALWPNAWRSTTPPNMGHGSTSPKSDSPPWPANAATGTSASSTSSTTNSPPGRTPPTLTSAGANTHR